jgi:hypothetical protein
VASKEELISTELVTDLNLQYIEKVGSRGKALELHSGGPGLNLDRDRDYPISFVVPVRISRKT